MIVVLDASAVIELVLVTTPGVRIRRRLSDPGISTHSPDLVDLEVINVLRRYVNAKLVTMDRATQAVGILEDLDLRRHRHGPMLRRIWSWRSNLTAYDAAYVALAEVLNGPLPDHGCPSGERTETSRSRSRSSPTMTKRSIARAPDRRRAGRDAPRAVVREHRRRLTDSLTRAAQSFHSRNPDPVAMEGGSSGSLMTFSSWLSWFTRPLGGGVRPDLQRAAVTARRRLQHQPADVG